MEYALYYNWHLRNDVFLILMLYIYEVYPQLFKWDMKIYIFNLSICVKSDFFQNTSVKTIN